MTAALGEAKVEDFLKEHTDWALDSRGRLVRKIVSADYRSAVSMANKIAALAEELNHHPELYLRWGLVVVRSITHDAGDTITGKDIELARKIDILDATN